MSFTFQSYVVLPLIHDIFSTIGILFRKCFPVPPQTLYFLLQQVQLSGFMLRFLIHVEFTFLQIRIQCYSLQLNPALFQPSFQKTDKTHQYFSLIRTQTPGMSQNNTGSFHCSLLPPGLAKEAVILKRPRGLTVEKRIKQDLL